MGEDRTSSGRKVLQGVPRAGYDVHWCTFPGSLYACLAYVGDTPDYDYVMGVSGAAFRWLWNRDDGGNIDLSYLGDEPFRRAFWALGYGWAKVPAEKEAMFEAVVKSIDRGVPAISFGIIGPPEAGVVAGYDREGQVLYGWSYFQEQKEHYYEKDDWFETMDRHAGKGLIVIGAKLPARPDEREILVPTLRWAIDLERTAQRDALPEHVAGLAACDAWADALEVDADYPADDPQVLGTRVMIYGDQLCMLEERHSAAGYLRQMAAAAPEAAEQLEEAAALYDAVADQSAGMWPWGYSMGADAQQGLADPEARRTFAAKVRVAREKEGQATAYLERALEALA